MLGGSSGINFMAYGRPCAVDIDDWSTKLGIRGWSWAELLPYFKRSEKLEVDEPNITDRDLAACPIKQDLHGLNGPIHTSMNTWQVPFEKTLLSAFDEVSGLSRPEEPYNGSHLGFYRSLFTTDRTGKPIRSYAASGYLAPATKRSNLRVLTNALACKILLENGDNESLLARGVELQHQGKSHLAFAKKEIILSAGPIQSPQILELSGIGDPKILGEAQVPCILSNSDVGNNLQERALSAVVYELGPGIMSLDSLFQDPALLKEHQKMYAEEHSGATSGCVSLTGYISYSSQTNDAELEQKITKVFSPQFANGQSSSQNMVFQGKQNEAIIARMRGPESADIQLFGTPANFNILKGHSNCGRLMSGPPEGGNACFSITASNMYPMSRGSVHIKSSNPLEAPLIDPGFLSHPVDVDVLAAGVAFADRVFRSARVKDQVTRRIDPPPEVDLQDRDAARNFVRERITTYHHALGTCAMGQVVDERLRVKGVQGLRVADASVLPMQLSTAPLATVYAAAEKAADMIKEDHQVSKLERQDA